MAKCLPPTPDTLRQLLDYDPETGALRWRKRPVALFDGGKDPEKSARFWNARYAGNPAFTAKDGKGYHHGSVLNHNHRAHRVAWAIHYGEWPKETIDHIDHDKTNNRISNLRAVSPHENHLNLKRYAQNTSGVTGVVWCKRTSRWQAQMSISGRYVYLGRFDNLSDAANARKSAEREHSFHDNHGTP